MPRPKKCRRICSMPQSKGFLPISNCQELQEIIITLDEYEVIRLLDLEKLSQEECANQMNVARTTVTAIYDSARRKMADALVNGKKLFISGGNISLCEHNNGCCGKGCMKKCFASTDAICDKKCCNKNDNI